MSSYVRILSPRVALGCVALLALAACERVAEKSAESPQPAAELAWARSALDRNPQIEVIATDTQSHVFTIRDKSTGAVQAVKLEELAAAPASQFKSTQSAAATSEAHEAMPAAESAPAQQADVPSTTAAPQTAEQLAATPARPATPVEAKNYTVERADGQVRVTGPGVSIVSSGPAAVAEGGPTSQRASEPIICEGRRMLHLDNRDIYVDGDAITARGGCELYITNSRIIASGIGIIVQDATVHVSNSHVEGLNGAFDANDRARMYVRASTFQGVPKRTQLATVQDQGGNRWR